MQFVCKLFCLQLFYQPVLWPKNGPWLCLALQPSLQSELHCAQHHAVRVVGLWGAWWGSAFCQGTAVWDYHHDNSKQLPGLCYCLVSAVRIPGGDKVQASSYQVCVTALSQQSEYLMVVRSKHLAATGLCHCVVLAIRIPDGGVTKCIVCVQGHDPLTFFSCHPFFLIGQKFYGPNYPKC